MGTLRHKERRLCVRMHYQTSVLLHCSAIHRSSCISASHVSTPPALPLSLSPFFPWVSFLLPGSLGGFRCLPSSTSFSPCCLLSLLPLISRLPKPSRLLLPVFWFLFLPLTSFSLSGALKQPLHLFLKKKSCFFIFSISPSPSTARCILCSWRFSSCFFFCLLLQDYLWWRRYPALLLYLLI